MDGDARISVMKQIGYAISDTWVITLRNIKRNFRLPQLLVFSSIQPVMFLLLFNYVFGGAVEKGDGNYIDFLLPGILVQTAMFGAIQTGVGLAEDMQRGVVNRFRSLPMSRIAHMAGRIFSDALRNVIVVSLMMAVGLLIGFRFHNGLLLALAAFPLTVFFGFAFSWIAAIFGLLTKDSETAQVSGFLWTFPMTFASAVFVPVATMPGWLQAFANNQPVTHAAMAVRNLTQGGDLSDVWKTIAWVVGIVIVAAPVATYLYRRSE